MYESCLHQSKNRSFLVLAITEDQLYLWSYRFLSRWCSQELLRWWDKGLYPHLQNLSAYSLLFLLMWVQQVFLFALWIQVDGRQFMIRWICHRKHNDKWCWFFFYLIWSLYFRKSVNSVTTLLIFVRCTKRSNALFLVYCFCHIFCQYFSLSLFCASFLCASSTLLPSDRSL